MCYTGEAVGPAKVRHGVLTHLVTTESSSSSVAAAFFDLAEIFQLNYDDIIILRELQEKFEENGMIFESFRAKIKSRDVREAIPF